MNLDVTFVTSVPGYFFGIYQLNKSQSCLADTLPCLPDITLPFKTLVLKLHTTAYYFKSLVLTFSV
jgi:hypothetical protein